MMRLRLILGKELKALVVSPAFWIFTALAWFVTGLIFRYSLLERSGGDLSLMLQGASLLVVQIQLIFVPLLTMRSLAEEKKSGTFEMLITAPVKDYEVVLGKFLAIWLTNAVVWLVVPLLFAVLGTLGVEPDFGPVWVAYAGLVLVSGVFVAVGLLASASTRYQILAGFLSVVMLMVLLYFPVVAARWSSYLGQSVRQLMMVGNLREQVREASAGLLDLVNVTYQVSLTALVLLVTVRIVEIRKWR